MKNCKSILIWVHIFMLVEKVAGSTSKEYTLLEEKRITAVAGRDRRIILSCPYTRRIPVEWRKDGRVVYNSRSTITSFGTLTIRPVVLAVEGLYECRSEDLYDNGYKAIFNVSINEYPRILQRNKRHLNMNGSSADLLDCKANGKPKPDVFWINEKGFSPISPPKITQISETTLKVANLKSGDSRVLICVAQNVHGRVKVKFKIGPETKAAVMAKQKIKTTILPTTAFAVTHKTTTEKPGRAPSFTTRPSRITYARLGERLVIDCNAEGEPKPAIVISKIRPNKFNLRGKTIRRMTAAYLGVYECRATNKYGMIRYPFLLKIRGIRRRVYNYKKKWKIYNPYARSLGQWSQWSRCSVSCGVGFQLRTRTCHVAQARLRARLCRKQTIMQKICYRRHC